MRPGLILYTQIDAAQPDGDARSVTEVSNPYHPSVRLSRRRQLSLRCAAQNYDESQKPKAPESGEMPLRRKPSTN